MVEISDEVNQILTEKGITDTKAVPPKIALPIFEDSSLEDDPNIQSLWNHLLANAMNPQFNDDIRYGFIEMIKNITGIEAKLLNNFYDLLQKKNKLYPLEDLGKYSLEKEQLIQMLSLSKDQYALHLQTLGIKNLRVNDYG